MLEVDDYVWLSTPAAGGSETDVIDKDELDDELERKWGELDKHCVDRGDIFNDSFKQKWWLRLDGLMDTLAQMDELLSYKEEKESHHFELAVTPTPPPEEKVVIGTTKVRNVAQLVEEEELEKLKASFRTPEEAKSVSIVNELSPEEKEKLRIKNMLMEMERELAAEEMEKERKRQEKEKQEEEARKAAMSEKVVMAISKKDWIQGDKCLHCAKNFNLKRRRHHCRNCGGIYCSACCSQKTKVPGRDDKEVRVCVRCWGLLLDRQIEQTIILSEEN